ncbi:hypothetical protein [Streptomyces sp. NBC_00932]|uniref:hypothetical protein n=1 Tax=Streptomyces sp. NBC_00932 TaxID=2903690 RepID=UPI0038668ACE|nr:hypothetical protein OG221_27735 [Streptomyces sp. NBC_00932]
MRASSWLLLFVLAALAVHYPWAPALAVAGIAAAIHQPEFLFTMAFAIVGVRIHRRFA